MTAMSPWAPEAISRLTPVQVVCMACEQPPRPGEHDDQGPDVFDVSDAITAKDPNSRRTARRIAANRAMRAQEEARWRAP